MIFSFDFETWLITPGNQLPPGVCMSWAQILPPATAGAPATIGGSGVVLAADGCQHLLQWLEAGAHIVGANTAFDALVSVVTCARFRGDWRRLLRAWVRAYEEGRVHDVFVRQKLLDIAAGCYRFEERNDGSGKFNHYGYNLADLSRRLTGRRLSKPEDEDDTDHWRLRFGELEGVPIASYPKEAHDYALEDAIATAEDFIVQEVKRWTDKRIGRNFPGKDPFVDETRQTMACVPLKHMSAYGLRTNEQGVERFAEEVIAKIEESRADLVSAGLVRPPSFHRFTDKIGDYIRKTGKAHYFADAAGVLRLNQANYWAAANDVEGGRPDGILAYLGDWKTTIHLYTSGADKSRVEALLERGLMEIEHTRDTKAAAQRCADAYTRQGKPIPRTDAYDPKPAEKGGKGHGPLDCVSLDADACSGSEDPILELYSTYSSLAKTLANDIPMLRAGVHQPVHTRFEELKKTGRTASSKPNVQNVRRLPGIRECFTPRAGYVYVDTDFGMLELHTLAQVCLWVLGFSTLSEALNGGKDPHLMIASRILKVAYDVAKARREAGDGEVDNARTAGKGVNFGRPGGLSAKTFVIYAWTNYRIRLTLDEAQDLLSLYDQTWTEMPSYFRWVKGLKDPYSVKTIIDKETGLERETCRYNIVQPWSSRLRAGAGYCEACNSPFQGLGSDVAKRALWLVWKATMGLPLNVPGVEELGDADPLFDAHPVNFVHDSIMTEVLEARAHAAAMRQKELMEAAGREILPGCPVKVDALVTRHWSKKASQRREACSACGSNGKCKCGTWQSRKLVPWDLRVAVREALQGWATEHGAEGRDAAFAYLQKKQWPRDVSREAVIDMFGGENVAGRIGLAA